MALTTEAPESQGPAGPAPAPAPPRRFLGALRGRQLPSLENLALVLLALFGLLVRLGVLASRMGVLDSDEAVVGLMARGLLHGHTTAFFWGQHYGGSHEAILAALLFRVVGPSTGALKAVPVILSGVAALLTWRVGRRLYGEAAGRWAGLLVWVAPAAFVWWSTKAGVYWAPLCLCLAAVLFLLRLQRPPGTPPGSPARADQVDAAALGLVAGLAWWGNPQSLYLLLPAAVLAPAAFKGRLRLLPLVGGAFLLGMAPWLWHNLGHGFASLQFPPHPKTAGTYGYRFSRFFRDALPAVLGIVVALRLTFVFGSLGVVAYGVALEVLAVAVVRCLKPSATNTRVLAVTALAYPFLFAVSPLSWYVSNPRYLLFLAPTLAMLFSSLLTSRRIWIPVFTVVVALTVGGLMSMDASGLSSPNAPDVILPTSFAPLEHLLAANHIRTAFADYWLAYRTTFETGERVLVSPVYDSRDAAIARAVLATPNPAYLFVTQSGSLKEFLYLCGLLHVRVVTQAEGPFTLAEPQGRVLPAQTAAAWNA